MVLIRKDSKLSAGFRIIVWIRIQVRNSDDGAKKLTIKSLNSDEEQKSVTWQKSVTYHWFFHLQFIEKKVNFKKCYNFQKNISADQICLKMVSMDRDYWGLGFRGLISVRSETEAKLFSLRSETGGGGWFRLFPSETVDFTRDTK
jgi:hypothetical protein